MAGQLGHGTSVSKNSPVLVSGLTNVTAIAGGNFFATALKSDGTVWGSGLTVMGQRSVPTQIPGATNVTLIAGGSGVQHTLALKADGTMWAWAYGGANSYGQLGDGSTIARSAPVQVLGLTGVVSLAVGDNHSLALQALVLQWC
jgi:alpha-tubulin suppressor-like RCC1 family protein